MGSLKLVFILEIMMSELWSTFWKYKTYRKFFLKVTNSMSSVQAIKSRTWFLSQCYKYGVCPKTLRSKTVPPKQLSQILAEEWKKVQLGLEHKFVKLAHQEVFKGDLVRNKEKLIMAGTCCHCGVSVIFTFSPIWF